MLGAAKRTIAGTPWAVRTGMTRDSQPAHGLVGWGSGVSDQRSVSSMSMKSSARVHACVCRAPLISAAVS